MLNVDQQRRLASVLRDSSQSQCERDAAKRALLESNLRFAFAIAKQHQGRGVELAELVADANLGLIRAVERYDPRFGVPFIRYAAPWIHHAIRDGIARQRHTVSVPSRHLSDMARLKRAMHELRAQLGRAATPHELAVEIGLSSTLTTALLGVLAGELSFDECSDPGFSEREPPCTNDELRAALSSLSQQERDIIMLSFGLGDRAAASNDEIGHMLKLSPERVRQIRERALVRLRRGQRGALLHEIWANQVAAP